MRSMLCQAQAANEHLLQQLDFWRDKARMIPGQDAARNVAGIASIADVGAEN